MKTKLLAAAAVALGLAHAVPSQATPANISGYYLATFTLPGGSFSHCFALTQTDQYPGYTSSGTWTDTDFPNTGGTYIVYKRVVHLAGYVGDPSGTDYLTLDGQISGIHLINTTYDYFSPSGIYFAVGSFAEYKDKACANPS